MNLASTIAAAVLCFHGVLYPLMVFCIMYKGTKSKKKDGHFRKPKREFKSKFWSLFAVYRVKDGNRATVSFDSIVLLRKIGFCAIIVFMQ